MILYERDFLTFNSVEYIEERDKRLDALFDYMIEQNLTGKEAVDYLDQNTAMLYDTLYQDLIFLMMDDFEYGLSADQVSLYANKQYSWDQIEFLSRAFRDEHLNVKGESISADVMKYLLMDSTTFNGLVHNVLKYKENPDYLEDVERRLYLKGKISLENLYGFPEKVPAVTDRIQILSVESCFDEDFGASIVQYRVDDNFVSFAFSDVDVSKSFFDNHKIINDLAGNLEETKKCPLWSDLSETLRDLILDIPFNMRFVEYDDARWDETKVDLVWAEIKAHGLDDVIKRDEDDCFLTVYAGAIGEVNWNGHPEYGKICLEKNMKLIEFQIEESKMEEIKKSKPVMHYLSKTGLDGIEIIEPFKDDSRFTIVKMDDKLCALKLLRKDGSYSAKYNCKQTVNGDYVIGAEIRESLEDKFNRAMKLKKQKEAAEKTNKKQIETQERI